VGSPFSVRLVSNSRLEILLSNFVIASRTSSAAVLM